ncbi:hypothetical protein [Paracidovorax wautersii]|uniref:Uncharacterized protein n=1 Tax=Paracidovorax wautersii TaxID=1177982 RepID=A0A1I2F3A5_9BURK|nr:hypothetical protein [Paracidovorax wautersii]SFE98990.1 hypothetical protein SAMN04489711_10948 [Paracidovorax wautersii]
MIALYKFRFYELDQPIEVGADRNFDFFVDPHYAAAMNAPIQNDMTLVFANTLLGPAIHTANYRCKILSITHLQLGEVQSIDTHGLDYTVKLADGRAFVVNAEEHPGKIEQSPVEVSDWAFLINIEPA